ncbi:MAG: hypothetical protein HYX78_07315 [Armatimonadetes bacterium]|nr:hypothetical protein [Armatimonadota bacterium]
MITPRCAQLLIGVIVFVVFVGAGIAAEEPSANPAKEKTVTLNLLGAPVIDAIDLVFKDTGYKYTIEPGVSGTIDLRFSGVPFERALRVVTETAGLNYRVTGGRYVIGPKSKPATEVGAKPAEPRAEDYERPAEQPEHPETQAPEDNPIFYGHVYPYVPLPLYYDVGYVRNYVVLPFGAVLAQGYVLEVPPVLPPPRFRPPSVQRMIDQMRAVRSIPGFSGYPIGSIVPCYPF